MMYRPTLFALTFMLFVRQGLAEDETLLDTDQRDSFQHCMKDTKGCKEWGLVNGICKEGYIGWTCVCQDGWEGSKCDQPKKEQSRNMLRDLLVDLLQRDSKNSCMTQTKDCSKHGECVLDGRNIEYICKCDEGYGGTKCQDKLNDLLERDSKNSCMTQTKDCSKHGECVLDGRQVEYICKCDEGYGGTKCQDKLSARDLLVDLLGRDSKNSCMTQTKDCSKHGECVLDGRQVEYICKCDEGYGGTKCQDKLSGKNAFRELLDLLGDE